jgi:hypothetical protein
MDLTHRSSDGTLMEPRGGLLWSAEFAALKFFKFYFNRMDGGDRLKGDDKGVANTATLSAGNLALFVRADTHKPQAHQQP